MEGSDTLDKVAKSVPGCKGISENATFRATSRRFATRSTVAKGLILNELVGCERSFVFFEAFTTEESVLQLGLQKMHNGTVHVAMPLIEGFHETADKIAVNSSH